MNPDDKIQEPGGSIFEFLFAAFEKHNVRAVLVGGYSLIANKVQRMTFDIDFMVTLEDCGKIEPELLAAGYSVFNRQSAFVQFKCENPGFRDLDFLIGDRQTIDQLASEGKTIRIAGKPFIVPSPKHLIAMKLHSIAGNRKREIKDFPDIVQLMKANGIDPASDEIKNLFRKYDLMDLYNRILE